MKNKQVVQTLAFVLALVAVSVLFPDAAHAAKDGTGMAKSFTGGINSMRDTLLGIAKPVGILLIAVGGLTWAFTRHEEGFKKIGQAFVGIGVVIAAMTIGNTLFSGSLF